MFVDVLKRYLLIVWNFFFGQGSTESIQESPKDDQPTATEPDPVPSAVVDDNQDEVTNEEDVDDDIEEIFDDEEEEGEEEDGQEEEDEEVEEDSVDEKIGEKADVPKKPEDKTVASNDVPAKPAGKAEEPAKKQPEAPKASDVKQDEPKVVKDQPKPDGPAEKQGDSVKPSSKPEFEIIEREDVKPAAPPAKDAFEVRERDTVVKPAAGKDTTTTETKSNQEFEIVEKDAPEKEGLKEKTEKPIPDGDAAGSGKPKDDAKKTVHVKFEDEVAGKADDRDVKVAAGVSVPQKPQTNNSSDFVVSEKGEDDGPKSAAGRDAIDSFLLGEQRHSGGVHHHQESIQDQQLEYSDSGEELSDDDIEIDYEDDEDDEEVEEVKPLPPVARSVYKKND